MRNGEYGGVQASVLQTIIVVKIAAAALLSNKAEELRNYLSVIYSPECAAFLFAGARVRSCFGFSSSWHSLTDYRAPTLMAKLLLYPLIHALCNTCRPEPAPQQTCPPEPLGSGCILQQGREATIPSHGSNDTEQTIAVSGQSRATCQTLKV